MGLLLLLVGLTVAFLALKLAREKESRDAVLRVFRLRPQVKNDTESVLPSVTIEEKPNLPAYEEMFPPHRREAFAELSSNAVEGKDPKQLSKEEPTYAKMVPDKEVCNDDSKLDHYTPTGFTVDEIRRLGDFPDYATLSGIPLPKECTEFNLETALPRPYRPLRWPYHQTMALAKLDSDFWLEIDKEYEMRLKYRHDLFMKHGKNVLQVRPGAEIATKELMEMCLQFMHARWPMHFKLDTENKIFHNYIMKTQTNLKRVEPIQVLLNNIPEDFAIMIRDPKTGLYSFRAGMIVSSLGWSLGTKIGLKLHEIHAPIPDYKEKMEFSMDRYFAKKPTERAIQRGSWGLEIDEPLYMPEGDPHERLREAQNPAHTIDQCNFRVDWQTLRRLPLSGAIVFNFKGLFTPVKEFRDEPFIPSMILKVIREGKENIMEYKSTWHTEHVVVPALEEYEREQIEKGLIPKDWEPKTLEETPFFPGWEEKWHRQQGF